MRRLLTIGTLVSLAACSSAPDPSTTTDDDAMDDPSALGAAAEALGPTRVGTCPPPAGTTVAPSPGWSPMDESQSSQRALTSAVWDGYEAFVAMGSRYAGTPQVAGYDPVTRRWRALANAPIADRLQPFVVWTGNALLVWGGITPSDARLADGALYDPCTNAWVKIRSAPIKWRVGSTAVWADTTNELLVWGGVKTDGGYSNTGYAYKPSTNTWRTFGSSPLTSRRDARAVWAGRRMIVFGGRLPSGDYSRKTAAYDPATGTWTPIANPPIGARIVDVALATDDGRAIFWGGTNATALTLLGDGAILDVARGTWSLVPSAMDAFGSSFARHHVGAWWAFGRLYMWTGTNEFESADHQAKSDGAMWDPSTRRWSWMPQDDGAMESSSPFAVWTGEEALIWGGSRAGVGMGGPLAVGSGRTFRP
jgi:N-acetylneuraminic acid mutarotase